MSSFNSVVPKWFQSSSISRLPNRIKQMLSLHLNSHLVAWEEKHNDHKRELVQLSKTAQLHFHSVCRTTGVYRIHEVNSCVYLAVELIHNFCLSVEIEEAASLPSDSYLHTWQNSTESRRTRNKALRWPVLVFLNGGRVQMYFHIQTSTTGTTPFK